LKFIREELFIVLGGVVGIRAPAHDDAAGTTRLASPSCSVLPAGYSFNMDGSHLSDDGRHLHRAGDEYPLTFWQEMTVILICLITSKALRAWWAARSSSGGDTRRSRRFPWKAWC
jgi:hypothetical protein